MKGLPIGIQNFREIRKDNYVYADKTRFVHMLLRDVKHCFLSRPRRFGKSLLLDTISEAFSGDKELFNGLFLYDSGFDFEWRPVLRLDMNSIANKTPEKLEESLSLFLSKLIKKKHLISMMVYHRICLEG